MTPPPAALPYRCTLPVLGIRVHFEANDPRPIAIAEEAFGAWRGLESDPALIDGEPVHVRIAVGPGREGDAAHAEFSHLLTGRSRVTITTSGSRAVADAGRGEAILTVTEELVGDRQHFRYGMLESATLFLVTSRDRQPVHAAAIIRAGAVLALAGPSGMGKSTLAYAAATRLGCEILAEDVVNVQMRPSFRLWGLSGFLHLPPGSARHFPELMESAPTLLANGKTKIAVAVERIGALPRVPFASRSGICILEPGGVTASLEALDPGDVVAALTHRLEPGFDLYADTVGDCIAGLAASGGWRLRTTSRPADVLPLLDRALAMIAGQPPSVSAAQETVPP